MLRRLWLSAAWVSAVLGALLGAGLSWSWIQDTKSSMFDNELNTILLSGKDPNPRRICWLSSWDSVYVEPADQTPPSFANQRLDPESCVKRLELENEKLEEKVLWLWAGLVAALTLWPAIVFGIYRWGLWLVGAKRNTTAALPMVSDDKASLV